MSLSANRDVPHLVDTELRRYAVAGSTHVYRGALLGINASGYVTNLTAGLTFVGLAYEEVDNTSGADGAKTIRVYTEGDFQHALSGAAVADVGKPVFATDENTLTLTDNGSYVGVIVGLSAAGQIYLRLDVLRQLITGEQVSLGTVAATATHVVFRAKRRCRVNALRIVAAAGTASDAADHWTIMPARHDAAGGNAADLLASAFDTNGSDLAAYADKSLGTLQNNALSAGDNLAVTFTKNNSADDLAGVVVDIDYTVLP
jgi:hypothetical protein